MLAPSSKVPVSELPSWQNDAGGHAQTGVHPLQFPFMFGHSSIFPRLEPVNNVQFQPMRIAVTWDQNQSPRGERQNTWQIDTNPLLVASLLLVAMPFVAFVTSGILAPSSKLGLRSRESHVNRLTTASPQQSPNLLHGCRFSKLLFCSSRTSQHILFNNVFSP